MSFIKFIVENHPDPDSLLNPKFDQMCILAEKYAESLQSLQSCVIPSNLVLKQTNCRWSQLQEIANRIGKDRIINIQRMYADDDIYFLYYWA